MTRAVQVIVRGRVQGVGFRYSALWQAKAHELGGWVRNRDDGSVECWLEGPAPSVAAMLEWLATGPGFARVSKVEVHDRSPAGFTRFEVVADA
ncbi:MAG: acylphosphatase [Acidobacteriota bacterium]|jgi:acylphosphatase|nr:acylphosphatase [Acidobacteriota bacterium]NLH70392.1 acylphosphatase [Brooklawnia sp.]